MSTVDCSTLKGSSRQDGVVSTGLLHRVGCSFAEGNNDLSATSSPKRDLFSGAHENTFSNGGAGGCRGGDFLTDADDRCRGVVGVVGIVGVVIFIVIRDEISHIFVPPKVVKGR